MKRCSMLSTDMNLTKQILKLIRVRPQASTSPKQTTKTPIRQQSPQTGSILTLIEKFKDSQ